MRRVIVIAVLVLVLGCVLAGAVAARRFFYFGPAAVKPDTAAARAALVAQVRTRLAPAPGTLDEAETWEQRRERGKALCAAAIDALAQGDTGACLARADEVLALATTVAAECDMLTTLMARAQVAHLAREVRDAVLRGRGDADFAGTFARRLLAVSLTSAADVVEGERLAAEELVWAATSNAPIRRINRAANLNHLRTHWVPWTAFARLTSAERRGRPQPEMQGFEDRSYPAVGVVAPALDRCVESTDQWLTVKHGWVLFFGVEAFRAKTGRLPGALMELVPEFTPALPEDPMHARGFVYRLVPGAADGRGYTLYSVGRDGIDNGGVVCERGNAMGLHSGQCEGTDYLIFPVPESDY